MGYIHANVEVVYYDNGIIDFQVTLSTHLLSTYFLPKNQNSEPMRLRHSRRSTELEQESNVAKRKDKDENVLAEQYPADGKEEHDDREEERPKRLEKRRANSLSSRNLQKKKARKSKRGEVEEYSKVLEFNLQRIACRIGIPFLIAAPFNLVLVSSVNIPIS